jgi:uncharacterized protein YcbK (DUF882 family)
VASQAITPHFHVAEFDCHDGTKVPQMAMNELHGLCANYLEPLRAKFGAVLVHSGYRTTEYNRRIGGARQSFHIYTLGHRWGVAADVECAKGDVDRWWQFIARLRRDERDGRGGLGRYPQGGFIHVDNRTYQADWEGP